MIIKSMARKQTSFGQLIEYMEKPDETLGFTINCWSGGSDPQALKVEFLENAENLPKRKGGNILYHEILALSENQNLSVEDQKPIIRDLVQKYLSLRAPNQLVFAKIHTDTPYLHCHMMISANEIGANKRVRLSKQKFSEIQQVVERYKLERYGEHFSEVIYGKGDRTKTKASQKEYEYKQRTGKPSRKDVVRDVVKQVFAQSDSELDFVTLLAVKGFEFYRRGKAKAPGILDTASGKRYRLKTLALETEFVKFDKVDQLAKLRQLEKSVDRELE